MAQFARPDSNVTQTNFTNGFANIDEASPSDADFAFGANNTVAELEVGLSDVTDPSSSSGHVFRYRIAKTNAGTVDGGGNAVTVTARLMQGTTEIATDTAKTADGTWTQYAYTLTSGEADAITSYTDLRLEFVTSASGGSPANRRGGAVSWAELEVPDIGGAQNLGGALFQKAPTFSTGAVTASFALVGVLFASTPTFPTGTVSTTYSLTGTTFQKAPSFFAGIVGDAYTNLVVVELDDAGAPDTDLNHFLRANARTDAGTGFIRIRLFQDTTEIAGFEFEPTGTFTTYSYELLEAEAAAITDYNDLQIHIDIRATGTPFTPEVDWVDLQRPVAGVNLAGDLFQKAPTFNVGTVTSTYALSGTLFTKAPTFNVGTLTSVYNLAGVLYQNTPSFPTGAVAATYNLAGVLFQKAPTFPTGTVAATYNVAGILFTKAPTFPQGSVTSVRDLAGVLFVKAPTFPAGVVGQEGGPQLLGGTLFQKAPTFPQGTVTAGTVNVSGVLFQKTPLFNTGTVSASYALTGTLFQNTPTFPVGSLIQQQFLTGTPFQKAPTFPQGLVALAGSLDGVLYQNTPLFFTGTMTQTGGSFWRPDPLGYTQNPVGYTRSPVAFTRNPIAYTLDGVAYTKVGPGDVPPWAIDIFGELFQKAPTFPVGTVS